MKKVLALGLFLPLFGGIIMEQPAHANWFKKNLPKLDPTARNSDVSKFGRKIDPTNPNSAGGRFTRKAFPVACGVAGAIKTSPAALTGAGIAVTAGSAVAAHQGCYKIVQEAQK
ncbi:hypothetical protein [Chamaesiphon polymorphus]|uniref:Uncharacterized protein n=1 Tax=Chamaesiphon polymorphus CCALA 037 TaxID=2107692 RepID=A0A2T1GAJ1_9CYAN|nr:hypothetical protein [Chamaesiphon polymorphus]PSB54288.1 hypothetical protein C7B77_18585 [Chamaesiphon polymorphus CCALA 037]